MTSAPTDRVFVPADFDPSDFAHIRPLLDELLERRVGSVEELRAWVLDMAALAERIDEYGTRRYIDAACHTDDEQIEKAYLHFVRQVEPKLRPMLFKLQQRYLRNPLRHDLYEAGFAMLELRWQAEVDVYRDQNVPLHTRATELANEYGKLTGAMTVEFRGQTYTLQQLARFLDEPDRQTRKQAWEAGANRRLRDAEKVEDIFEQLLDVRQRIAANADFADYRGYAWVAKKRFDYTPADCIEFGEAIERQVVPLVRALDEQRKAVMGVDPLRPWDTSADVKGRPPLRPFDPSDIDRFVAGVREMFRRVSPALAERFDTLAAHGDLDLESRRGKRPGGFQAALEASRRPFIFMNAAGVQRDVQTLLHEGGHAFHFLAAGREPNLFVRHSPIEFAEVASFSMELLASDHYDVFYQSAEDAARAKRQQLEGIIRFFPWMATIDGFQHWLYTHPGHSRAERAEAWLALLDRFTTGVVDHSGCEDARRAMWHRQMHLFHAPFYYVEYGIAQLGALRVWRNYQQDPEAALAHLLDAFALGGTRPLAEIFATAGARFDFSEDTLHPLIDAVREQLEALPA